MVLEEEDPPCKVLLFVLSMSLDCAALDSYITLQYHTMLSHISFFFLFFSFFLLFLLSFASAISEYYSRIQS